MRRGSARRALAHRARAGRTCEAAAPKRIPCHAPANARYPTTTSSVVSGRDSAIRRTSSQSATGSSYTAGAATNRRRPDAPPCACRIGCKRLRWGRKGARRVTVIAAPNPLGAGKSRRLRDTRGSRRITMLRARRPSTRVARVTIAAGLALLAAVTSRSNRLPRMRPARARSSSSSAPARARCPRSRARSTRRQDASASSTRASRAGGADREDPGRPRRQACGADPAAAAAERGP